jgi:CheY-like chemotaxis protein
MEPRSILLFEDNDDNRAFFCEVVESLPGNYRVMIAFNAQVGLDMLFEYAPADLPDLVIMDMDMQLKTGLQCLDEIRANAALKSVPIGIFTASTDYTLSQEARKKGSSFYISKSDSLPELCNQVKELLTTDWKVSLH